MVTLRTSRNANVAKSTPTNRRSREVSRDHSQSECNLFFWRTNDYKIKRVEYCQYLLDTAETFDDVFTDETMVIIINHNVRKVYHKRGEPRKYKPRVKYPTRVLVWGGISLRLNMLRKQEVIHEVRPLVPACGKYHRERHPGTNHVRARVS